MFAMRFVPTSSNFSFTLQTAAEACECAITPDYAMTRHDDGHWVIVVGLANRAKCSGASDLPCNVTVRTDLAVRDLPQGFPASLLKFGATQIQRTSEFPEITAKIALQFGR